MENRFIETVRDCYLHQHNNANSRRRGNDRPSLIDLVFSDEQLQVSDVVHHAPLGKSDHSVICFNYHCYLDYSKPKKRYFYNKADFGSMKNELLASKWVDKYIESNLPEIKNYGHESYSSY